MLACSLNLNLKSKISIYVDINNYIDIVPGSS